MPYSSKNKKKTLETIEERDKLQKQIKKVRVQEKLGKQYFAKELLEPVTEAVFDTRQEVLWRVILLQEHLMIIQTSIRRQ